MKKKSKYLLMFIGVFFISMICGIQNVFASTLIMDFTGYWYERSDNGNNYSSWKLQNYLVDGNVAYCIEPGIPEGTNQYIQGSWENAGLSNSIKERVLLLSYYGYQYNGHQTQKFRTATQAMIWETILGGNTKVTFSTERYGKGAHYDVSYERAVIENLVAHHYDRPSFNGTTITGQVGIPITLTDTNNVLNNYEVYASNDAEIRIDGNNITIIPTRVGNINLKLMKKQLYSRSYLIYYANGYQNMLSGGNVDPVVASINIKSLGGKIEFYKLDIDTNSNKPVLGSTAKLNGAVYGIYDAESDVLIEKLTTNIDGYAISNNLPNFGNYYLKEIKPSEGYTLDTTKYYFSSILESVNASLKVKEEVISRNFEFTKVYASSKTGIMIPEVGIDFGIYDLNNNLISKKTTDKDGKIYVNLPYGKFILKQLTTIKDHEYMEDYNFEVVELGETNKVFANAPIEAKLKVIKVDAETGNVITRSNIKFKIFNVDTGKYVSQIITYPTAGTIDVFETDSNGILITPYPLTCGTYRLEEVDQVIDGYLWNKESVEFHIGENAEFITDNEYGVLFEVKFKNTPVKGLVEITKTGESVEFTENGYVYTKINLSGVKIGLYANEDIYDNFNNLIYQKNDLVNELITDENGYAKVDNLFLGKYFLKEIETVNNHMLNENKYEFELKYKDQYTSVIEYEIIIENHLPKGTLEFTKTDFSTSQTLPNTKIEIYTNDENNNLVYSGYTDENGKIIITELPVGKYYILETEAPSGYELNTEKMEFEILNNGDVIKCTMTNELIITDVPNTEENQFPVFELLSLCICALGLGVVAYAKKKKSK